jgi:hypothetical protein
MTYTGNCLLQLFVPLGFSRMALRKDGHLALPKLRFFLLFTILEMHSQRIWVASDQAFPLTFWREREMTKGKGKKENGISKRRKIRLGKLAGCQESGKKRTQSSEGRRRGRMEISRLRI